jgi:hypothetical protein
MPRILLPLAGLMLLLAAPLPDPVRPDPNSPRPIEAVEARSSRTSPGWKSVTRSAVERTQ